LNAPVPAILLPSLARVGAAALAVIGPPDVRERLRLAEAGKLAEGDAVLLGKELDTLAEVLAPR
jgi:hypothetical protein